MALRARMNPNARQTSLRLNVCLAACLGTQSAAANPKPLPFSYEPKTLPKGAFEVEEYVDLVPIRVPREEASGTSAVTSVRAALQTEFEFGLTDSVELGWYFAFRQAGSPGTPSLEFQGVKQRLRFRLAEDGAWPVNVGLYFEIAEFHNELEFEQKALLSRRFGALNLVANLWLEEEFYFQTEETKVIYNPTVGTTYELSPKFTVGAEYWVRGRFGGADPATPSSEVRPATPHYVGPTIMVQSAEYFLALGSYARLDALTSAPQVGDPWGKVWIRALLGIGL